MDQRKYHAITQSLAGLGKQRVWSLMVTLFGDLAQAEGQAIAGPVLSAVLSEMQIKPEAARVALHRLRNDGWIASQKVGRTSVHSLTDFGRSESAMASARIYAPVRSDAMDWQLVMLPDTTRDDAKDLNAAGFAPLAPRIYLGNVDAQPPKGAWTLKGEAVPDWVKEQFEPEGLAQDYTNLHRVLVEVDASLPKDAALSSLQTAVLRCLIVHNWRRLVLRHPDLPPELFTSDWRGHACHARVDHLLSRFPRPGLDRLMDA